LILELRVRVPGLALEVKDDFCEAAAMVDTGPAGSTTKEADVDESPLEELKRLHTRVDDETADLVRRHVDRLQCAAGCCECCVDDITVFEIEAERIRRRHADFLSGGTPHPVGRCAFLDERGSCRIYEDRPYVCRTQGLPLRWLEDDQSGRTVEFRDICPLNASPSRPVESLTEEDCWTIGPVEGDLARIQIEFGGNLRRLRLRDLFGAPDPPDIKRRT